MHDFGRSPTRISQRLLVAGMIVAATGIALATWLDAEETTPRSAAAAWGGDHVGQRFPEYVTGDECLFCHREIGPTWNANRHQLTIRRVPEDVPVLKALRLLEGGDALAEESDFVMGGQRMTRLLKKSKEYGKLDLLSVSIAADAEGRLVPSDLKDDVPHWDSQNFANRCAGCHATAVDAKSRAFSSTSLDCFSCHGDVDLAHTKDVAKVFLSSKHREPRQVTSTCGQCHLRGGTSRSTGLPYPNTFIAGDNLLRDFQVDLSSGAIEKLQAIEHHIFINTRDVALLEKTATTCLSCHDVHQQRTEKHKQLDDAAICSTCHVPDSDNAELLESVLPRSRRQTHSKTCDY